MRRLIDTIILLICAIWLCWPARALAETNLAKNGDLSAGAGLAPDDWYALASDKKLSTFSWTRTLGHGGVLEIANLDRNFASWHQALMLRPGTYEVSAEVRVEDAGADQRGGGANLAVQSVDGRVISEAVHGASDWRKISFLLKEARWGDTTQLLCQLGLDGDPDTGRASFRNIKVIAI